MITPILVFGGFLLGTVGAGVPGRKGGVIMMLGSVIMTAGLTLFIAKNQ